MNAQNSSLLLQNCPDSISSNISLNSNYTIQTNGFSGKFIKAIKQSDYLSEDLKKSNPIKSYNYINYDLKEELSFFCMPDTLLGMGNTGLHVGISYEQWFTGSFNNDLYNLIALGNKEFAGKEADLSNSLFQYLNYGTFSLGIFKVFNDELVTTKALFDINLHTFKDFQYLFIPTGSLFTEDDGSFIDFKAKGYYHAKSEHKNFNIPGISFNAAIKLTHKESETSFTFQVEQLGAIFLNRKSYFASIDTSIRYNGVEISQILNNPHYTSGILSDDSISDLYKKHMDTTASTVMLPEIMKFAFSKKFKSNAFDEFNGGLSYYFHTLQNIPEFYVSQTFKASKFIIAGVGVSYGGFSAFSTYVKLKVNVKKYELNLRAANLISYINQNSPYNTYVFLEIKKYW